MAGLTDLTGGLSMLDGVITINGEGGAVTLTSTGATILITTPTASTINLETAGGGGGTITPASVVVSPAGTSALTVGGIVPSVQELGNNLATGTLLLAEFNTTASTGAQLEFYRSKNATIGSATVVANGDDLGDITWRGAQQTGTFSNSTIAAQIRAVVDGIVTSGAGGDMPGRLEFATTSDGSGTPTTWMKLTNNGVLSPNTDGQSRLGQPGTAWWQLNLKSAGYIAFNSNAYLITHNPSPNSLEFSDLAIFDNGITFAGGNLNMHGSTITDSLSNYVKFNVPIGNSSSYPYGYADVSNPSYGIVGAADSNNGMVAGGYFLNGANANMVLLADANYSVNATGEIFATSASGALSVGLASDNQDAAAYFANNFTGQVVRIIDGFFYGATIYASDSSGNSVKIGDNTYAIQASGFSLFTSLDTTKNAWFVKDAYAAEFSDGVMDVRICDDVNAININGGSLTLDPDLIYNNTGNALNIASSGGFYIYGGNIVYGAPSYYKGQTINLGYGGGIGGGRLNLDGGLIVEDSRTILDPSTTLIWDNASGTSSINYGSRILIGAAGTNVAIWNNGNLVLPYVTASRALVSNASSAIISSATTSAELAFLSGTTSNVQTQINAAPSIVGNDRKTGLTAAQALATYTVGAADTTYMVSANILVTTATLHSFTATVSYTDEGNTARIVTLNFSTLAGALTPTIANGGGAAPYEGVPLHIRCKASTTIIIATATGGVYTTVTYNFEERIVRQ